MNDGTDRSDALTERAGAGSWGLLAGDGAQALALLDTLLNGMGPRGRIAISSQDQNALEGPPSNGIAWPV